MKYLILLLIFAVSCGTNSSHKKVHSYSSHATNPEGLNQSKQWADLSSDYGICGMDVKQSPLNIVPTLPGTRREWKLEYKKTSLNISHNENMQELFNYGQTIQVTPEEGSTITLDGKKYQLKQFHFHTPGEHVLAGKPEPMEIHFVHQSKDESFAVIVLLVHAGRANPHFEDIIKNLPDSVGKNKINSGVSIDLNNLLQTDLSAYHYEGSLSSPPCNKNVQWMVLKTPAQMSRLQISEFSTRLNFGISKSHSHWR